MRAFEAVWIVAATTLGGCNSEIQVLADRPSDEPDAGAGPRSMLRVTSVGAGQFHTCAVSAGHMLCWGENSGGALGTGDLEPRATPARVGADTDWVEVAAGARATCGRRLDGSIWCWGENSVGEVARDDLLPHDEPVQVSLPGPALRIFLKFKVACALLDDRSLWCWGDNFEGQLGQDDSFVPGGQPAPVPARVPLGDDWLMADTGQGHVCGIRPPGDLWCWGRNGGELGLGPDTPIQIRTPMRVGSQSDWVHVSAGQNHTCALRANGSLWCWGQDNDAQLGLEGSETISVPTEVGSMTGWSRLSVNTFGGCAIRAGELWCWGRNDEGQLGVGDTMSREIPTRVGSDTDWVDVFSGRFHNCAERADESLWCTGENGDGRLGVGDLMRRNVFTAVVGNAGTLE